MKPAQRLRSAWADFRDVIRVQRGWDQIKGEHEGEGAAANRRVPILTAA
jgi:hypothetical protein